MEELFGALESGSSEVIRVWTLIALFLFFKRISLLLEKRGGRRLTSLLGRGFLLVLNIQLTQVVLGSQIRHRSPISTLQLCR